MNNFKKYLDQLLLNVEKYSDKNNDLIKAKVIGLAEKYDEELLSLLMKDKQCRSTFF